MRATVEDRYDERRGGTGGSAQVAASRRERRSAYCRGVVRRVGDAQGLAEQAVVEQAGLGVEKGRVEERRNLYEGGGERAHSVSLPILARLRSRERQVKGSLRGLGSGKRATTHLVHLEPVPPAPQRPLQIFLPHEPALIFIEARESCEQLWLGIERGEMRSEEGHEGGKVERGGAGGALGWGREEGGELCGRDGLACGGGNVRKGISLGDSWLLGRGSYEARRTERGEQTLEILLRDDSVAVLIAELKHERIERRSGLPSPSSGGERGGGTHIESLPEHLHLLRLSGPKSSGPGQSLSTVMASQCSFGGEAVRTSKTWYAPLDSRGWRRLALAFDVAEGRPSPMSALRVAMLQVLSLV